MYLNPNNRRDPIEHDILVVRRKQSRRQFFRVEACQPTDPSRADYARVQELPPEAAGFRAIVGLACAETLADNSAGPAAPRGPIIAALPLHPAPTASAACTCYLINPENLTYETSWTTEEWNDQHVQLGENPIRDDDGFELLVATPRGRVYLLDKQDAATQPQVTVINLRLEAELWNQLRNGCVAGSVRLVAHPPENPRVVPVVNVEALKP